MGTPLKSIKTLVFQWVFLAFFGVGCFAIGTFLGKKISDFTSKPKTSPTLTFKKTLSSPVFLKPPQTRSQKLTPPPLPQRKRTQKVKSENPDFQKQPREGKLTVQVASYPTEQRAISSVSYLRNQGYEAYYRPAYVKKRLWFRVYIGAFKDLKAAFQMKKNLLREKWVSSAFIQNL